MRQSYQKLVLVTCIVISLAIICLTFNSFSLGTSRSLNTNGVSNAYIFPVKIAIEDIAVSIPPRIQNRNFSYRNHELFRFLIAHAGANTSRYFACGHSDAFKKAPNDRIRGEILQSLNTIFKLIASPDCQHFDVSPPVLL